MLELADGVEVYPGHVSGSLCGKGMSSKASTTLGFERRFNPMLQYTDMAAFITESAGRIVGLNQGPFVGSPRTVGPIADPREADQMIDVRPVEEYFAGHHAHTINIPIDGQSFATKAGYLLDGEGTIVVAASDAEEAERAMRGLRSVGFLEIAGWVVGDGEVQTTPVTLEELERSLSNGVQVLDVREPDERDAGWLPGSIAMPYRVVVAECSDLDRAAPVVTVCETGARASVAASALESLGFRARPVAYEGVAGWRTSGRPLVTSATAPNERH
jgi:rhodanese-related sulfurtransferase